jgi:2-oxoglutarate ferredoxin oxidoreductase subunit delta
MDMAAEASKATLSRKRKFRGTVQIYREFCKGCGYCVEFCPENALALSSEFNSRGYHPPLVVDEEACVGGGLCAAICPDFAIFARCEKREGDCDQSS